MSLFGELFLSEILKKPVLDPMGEEIGVLRDVSLVRGETMPKVDSLVIEKKREHYRIPWADLNLFNKRIMSANIYAKDMAAYGFPEDDLLAARDILDKQIVDANGAKVVRANDIKLEGFNGNALLVAVDVGLRGILRRLGFERRGENLLRLFRVHLPYNLISWNYIQPLHPKLSNIALTIPGQMVSELHPADLADLISQVSHDEGVQFIEGLDVETAAEAISELEPETQRAMLTGIDIVRAADIIEEMNPDSAADVLAGMPAEKAKEILESLERQDAQDIQELLNHESDTAGGLMTNEYIAYPPEITVSEVMEKFRKDAPEIESVYYIYVVDADEKLIGVASLKDLLLSSGDAPLRSIMESNIKTIEPEADEMTTVARIAKYNLVALPVVDKENYFLGIVTLDDVVDRILPPKAKRKIRGA